MSDIPQYFKTFVSNIETTQFVKVFLQFKNRDELEKCSAFFLDRVAANPLLAGKYALSAEKFKFVTGGATSLNLQKALVLETMRRIGKFSQSLSSVETTACSKAVPLYHFAGHLFNLKMLTLDDLWHLFELISVSKDMYPLSHKCYYLLMETVKKTLTEIPFEHSRVHQQLLNIIQQGPSKAPTNNPTMSSLSFPQLGSRSDFLKESNDQEKLTFKESLQIFKGKVDSMDPSNSQVVLKNITGDDITYRDEGKWQKYYTILLEKALSKPEVSLCVAKLCSKVSKSKNSSKNISCDDYKRFIQTFVTSNLTKSFEKCNSSVSYSLMNLIEKLLDEKFCSLKCISSFFDVLIENAAKNEAFAAKNLIQLISIVKRKVMSDKFKSLPEEKRQNILDLVASEKGCDNIEEIASYLGVACKREVSTESYLEGDVSIGSQSEKKPSSVGNSQTSSGKKKKKKMNKSKLIISTLQASSTQRLRDRKEFGVISQEDMEVLVNSSVQEILIGKKDLDKIANIAFSVGQIECSGSNEKYFQEQLVNFLKKKITESFDHSSQYLTNDLTEKLIIFISELFVSNVARQDTIESCMKLFFKHEFCCKFAVDCIRIMTTIIFPQVNMKKREIFKDFFEFFASLPDDNTNRVKVYKELLSRKNDWMNTEDFVELTPFQTQTELNFENDTSIKTFIEKAKEKMSTPRFMDNLVGIILNHALNNRAAIAQCAATFAAIRTIDEQRVIETLTQKLVSSFATTMKESWKAVRSNLFILFAELYREGVLADENLSFWTQTYVKDFSVEDLSHVSSVLSYQRFESDGHVQRLKETLEVLIVKKMKDEFTMMSEDISEVIDLLKIRLSEIQDHD